MCVPQVCHQLSNCACSFVQSTLGDDIPRPRLHSLCSSTTSAEVALTEHVHGAKHFASKLHASYDSHIGEAITHAMIALLRLYAVCT